jgi:hypothetical protein
MGDPAIFLGAALAMLDLDGDDTLVEEAASTAARIAHALPDPAIEMLRGRSATPPHHTDATALT